jgi:hypothetical protein
LKQAPDLLMRGAGQRSGRSNLQGVSGSLAARRRWRFLPSSAKRWALAFANRTAGRNLRHNESVLLPARIQHRLIRKSRQTYVPRSATGVTQTTQSLRAEAQWMRRIDPVEKRWKSES